MGRYLKLFKNHEEYEEYKEQCTPIEPLQPDEMPQEPPKPNHVIFYESSQKLAENTATQYPEETSGLHVNFFTPEITFHEYENGVGTIIFEDDVTEIGIGAFAWCENYGIKSVTVPNTVTSIGMCAFSNCGSVDILMYPDTPPSIGYHSFGYDSNNFKIFVSEENVNRYKSTWSEYSSHIFPFGYEEKLVQIENVCENYDLYKQEKIYISYDSGTTWEDSGEIKKTLIEAKSLSCGYAEKWVEDGTMCDGYNLYAKEKQQVSYDSGTTWQDSGETRKGALIEAKSTECGYDPSAQNIITYSASTKLTETTSDKTAGLNTNAFNTTITNHAFANGVGTITFADNVTYIGRSAFYSCAGITSIEIPETVTEIGYAAFYSGTSLKSITLPYGIINIGSYAFQNCSSLTSITINAITPPTLGTSVFSGTNNCPIYVPSGSVNAYKSASGWSTYASRIQAITE